MNNTPEELDPAGLDIAFRPRDTRLLLRGGSPNTHLFIIRKGSVRLDGVDLRDLDVVRRVGGLILGGNNAFTEGWALYAETLGKEMGLFEKRGIDINFVTMDSANVSATALIGGSPRHTHGVEPRHASVWLMPSLKSATPRPRVGQKAPSPRRIPDVLLVRTAQVPRLTA